MQIDLDPREYRSERPKPKEPFFGPGLGSFIILMIWIFVVAWLKTYVFTG